MRRLDVEPMLSMGKRLAVFSVKKTDKGATIWVRAGNAYVNRDGSLNVKLDVLPIDGSLHVREAAERKEIRDEEPPRVTAETSELAMAGVHS